MPKNVPLRRTVLFNHSALRPQHGYRLHQGECRGEGADLALHAKRRADAAPVRWPILCVASPRQLEDCPAGVHAPSLLPRLRLRALCLRRLHLRQGLCDDRAEGDARPDGVLAAALARRDQLGHRREVQLRSASCGQDERDTLRLGRWRSV